MFIKKDLRKIPVIFSDAAEESTREEGKQMKDLRLARRPAEFKGSIAPLCQPDYVPSLQAITSLSLYDCQISNLETVNFLASSCSNLEELNLGRNPLKHIPEDVANFPSLKSLWLDDCLIEGPIPTCLYALEKLEVLRISNNFITEIDEVQVAKWKNMQLLCLDGNLIESIPQALDQLTKLQKLLLRKNKIKELPEGVPGSSHEDLTLFHISSNELEALPSSITKCASLEIIYANANKIISVPTDFASLKALTHCNFSSNRIKVLDDKFVERFGSPDASGVCSKDSNVSMRLERNPILTSEVHHLSQTSDGNAMDIS